MNLILFSFLVTSDWLEINLQVDQLQHPTTNLNITIYKSNSHNMKNNYTIDQLATSQPHRKHPELAAYAFFYSIILKNERPT